MAELLGRNDELGALLDLLDQSHRSGESRVAVVSGEAGIGKTRLLAEFSNRASCSDGQVEVLVGYGQALATSLASEAYLAIRECLRSLMDAADDKGRPGLYKRLLETLRETAPDWLEAVPAVGGLMAAGVRSGQAFTDSRQDTSPDVSPLEQLLRFIEQLASRQPVLLILDDLHWADPASVDLLITLALKVRGPITIVLAYREDDTRSRAFGSGGHPIRRGLFQLQRYRQDCLYLELGPLSTAAIRQLLQDSPADHAISDKFVSEIAERSVGNPLFAESLLQATPEGSPNARNLGRNRLIMSVLEDGLTHLSPTDVQLLETAATIGFTFELDYLAQVLRLHPDELCDHLDLLMEERRLIEEAGRRAGHDRYSFHHPLLGELLLQRAREHSARWRRTNLHLVRILQEDGPGESSWDEALLVRAVSYAVESEQDAEAFRWSMKAGHRQFSLGAVTKARAMAEVAVKHALTSVQRFEARRLLVTCLTAEGDHEAAVRECDRAVSDLDGDVSLKDLYELKLVLARSLRMLNEWARMQEVLDTLEEDPTFVKAPQRAGCARMLRAEAHLCAPPQDLMSAEATLKSVLTLGVDNELQARVQGHLGLTALAAYDRVSAETWLAESMATADKLSHPYAKYEAIHWLSKKALACLELERAVELVTELMAVSEASGVAADAPYHLRDLSRARGLLRQYDAAAENFCRYFDVLGEESVDRGIMTLACQLQEIRDVHGDEDRDLFVDALNSHIDGTVVDPTRREALKFAVSRAGSQTSFDAFRFAVEALSVDRGEAIAAETIFRFDVPRLATLRATLEPDS